MGLCGFLFQNVWIQIQGAFPVLQRPAGYGLCVNHRGFHIRMPHHFLYGSDIVPRQQQMTGKGVAQRMRPHLFADL
jgi:hypothetical protein